MRGLVFFTSFCFFVLGYGNDFAFAAKKLPLTQSIDYNFQKNNPPQFKTKEHSNFSIFEYTDIELEEDYNNEEHLDNSNSVISLTNRFFNWEHNFSIIVVSECDTNYNPFNIPLGLLSLPVYLKNQVFRI